MEANTSGWLRLLPPSITPLKRTVENIKDPLYRFFEREVNFGLKLLQVVRLDLQDVAGVVCSAKCSCVGWSIEVCVYFHPAIKSTQRFVFVGKDNPQNTYLIIA